MELDIVRAWKDASYRQSLSAEQQALLPENPVGDFELTEAELDAVNGGSQGGSLVGCQFTGGDLGSQCPTYGGPNGSCEAFGSGANGGGGGGNPSFQESGSILTSLTSLLGLSSGTPVRVCD